MTFKFSAGPEFDYRGPYTQITETSAHVIPLEGLTRSPTTPIGPNRDRKVE